MDEETKALLRSIAHHLKWVIVLLLAILGMLIARALAWGNRQPVPDRRGHPSI